jgi:16S rRNA (adenine1518-N6/adenine1519-N6)-dimethyltransferase
MAHVGGASTKKSLGQHWLADPRYLKRIAEAAEIQPDDTVVEIGPGTGHLTKHLAARASRLIAVELDDDLSRRLEEAYVREPRVLIIHGDVLELLAVEILRCGGASTPYVVVGNLPYNVGTAIIRKFLQSDPAPRRIVATLQAEVAERMAAKPGEMSWLSVEAQVYAEAKLLFKVPRRAFRPPPKVQSAVVRLDLRPKPVLDPKEIPAFLEFAHAGFAAPRKRLGNSLAVGLGVEKPEAVALLEKAGVDPGQRPAKLDLEAWLAVFRAYRS